MQGSNLVDFTATLLLYWLSARGEFSRAAVEAGHVITMATL